MASCSISSHPHLPGQVAGRYRFLYEVDDEASVVYIINIGRFS